MEGNMDRKWGEEKIKNGGKCERKRKWGEKVTENGGERDRKGGKKWRET